MEVKRVVIIRNEHSHQLSSSHSHTVKKAVYSFTDILWRVFHILTEPVTFVSVNRRNNEAWAHIATYTEPVPLEYGKLATKYPRGYTDNFRSASHLS